MRFLLDVNILVALSWPNHVHHRLAREWFESEAPGGWLTTPATEGGFVRVSCNPVVFPVGLTPGEALAQLDRLKGWGRHRFVPDDVEMVVGDNWRQSDIVGHRNVADAHLLAIAHRAGAVLATLDAGVLGLAGAQPGDVLVLRQRG